jgi:hypothetical protein
MHMTTAVLERPISKSSKKTATAADGQVIYSASKPKAVTKADLAKHKEQIEKAAKSFAADVKTRKPAKAAVAKLAKALPKAKPEPKPRKVSAMWVIRTSMAESLVTSGKPATVEMISKACTEAGVPKSNATIQTIISDFLQCLAAMKAVGLVKA